MTVLAEGTYRSACGCLLHRRVGPDGPRWEAEDGDGTCREVALADTASPILLSSDPDWPCGPRGHSEQVLDPD